MTADRPKTARKKTETPTAEAAKPRKAAPGKATAGKSTSRKAEAAAGPAAARSRKRPAKAAGPADGARTLLALVEKTLDDGKAEDVVVIDLAGRSSIADFMVIATGRSQRQVVALAERLRDEIDKGRPVPSIEGLPQGDWVLVDAGDVIVHIFRPEVRGYYNLEKMWGSDAPDAAPDAANDAAPAGDGADPRPLSA